MEAVFNCGLQSGRAPASNSAQLAGSPKLGRHIAILLTPTLAHRHRGLEKGKESFEAVKSLLTFQSPTVIQLTMVFGFVTSELEHWGFSEFCIVNLHTIKVGA